jgi:hypothetical protein
MPADNRSAPARLTPAQRRRALHKGRLPRNLPGAASMPAPGAGEHHERTPRTLLDAELETSAWVAYDRNRTREEAAARFWSDLAAERDAAYEQWWSGFARLERTQWVTAA